MTDDQDWLARSFEDQRTRLRAVAYRILGSAPEADDAVQEAWLRIHRSDTDVVENLQGWLTTVVARISLDMLRSRGSRREDPAGVALADEIDRADTRDDPEHEAVVADSVGLALLAVLDRLSPAERVAFVLHDLFDLPFDEIAPVVERTPEAARQLASRGRRRVQGVGAVEVDVGRQRAVVDAFLAASRGGEFGALLALLDPDVVLRADAAAVKTGATDDVRGAQAVAEVFFGRAQAAAPALLDGAVGLMWAVGDRPRVAFAFRIVDDKITGIELIADRQHLDGMDWALLD
jgi:RNA polymerase sigma factor (sigma-70 family)